jgi:hypothetical protein
MQYNAILVYILAILVVYLIYIYLSRYGIPSIGSIFGYKESFSGNMLENDVIDNGTMTDNYTKLSESSSTLSHDLIPAQVPNAVFMDMVTGIKHIISKKIIKSAESCRTMNGEDGMNQNNVLRKGKTITLQCVPDLHGLGNMIMKDIYAFIDTITRERFNVKLDPALVLHDLHRNLNIMEAVLYPLKHSNLYTVHGIQYTTEDRIKKMVYSNIQVKDVLYTILTRRGIEIMNDTDYIVH